VKIKQFLIRGTNKFAGMLPEQIKTENNCRVGKSFQSEDEGATRALPEWHVPNRNRDPARQKISRGPY